MVKNGNGKKISLDNKTTARLEEYAAKKDESVSYALKEAVESAIDQHEAKEILAAACSEEKLNPDSRLCKNVERHLEH